MKPTSQEVLEAMFGAKADAQHADDLAGLVIQDFSRVADRIPTRDDLREIANLFGAVGVALFRRAGNPPCPGDPNRYRLRALLAEEAARALRTLVICRERAAAADVVRLAAEDAVAVLEALRHSVVPGSVPEHRAQREAALLRSTAQDAGIPIGVGIWADEWEAWISLLGEVAPGQEREARDGKGLIFGDRASAAPA